MGRAFRSVKRQADRPPHAQQAHHLNQRAGRPPRRRPAHSAVAKPLNEARDIFAVETARRHDDDSASPKEIGADKYSTVPETVDGDPSVARSSFPILPSFNFESDRPANQFDGEIEREISRANYPAVLE